MRKFEYRNGDDYKTFEAADANGIIKFMRDDSWSSTQTDKEFMRKTAKMASMWSGNVFRFDSKESFVKDLISSGILKEVSDEQNQ